MPNEIIFDQLTSGEIELLFDPKMGNLRSIYIDILTLLQDILGRYSSKGNPTVFTNIQEAEHLIFGKLRKIEHFRISYHNEIINNPHAIEEPNNRLERIAIRNTQRKSKRVIINSSLRDKLHFTVKTKEEIQLNDYKVVKRALYRTASSNVGKTLYIKSNYGKLEQIIESNAEVIDTFLESLLNEYQQLRKPSKKSSLPSKPNQRKSLLKSANKTEG